MISDRRLGFDDAVRALDLIPYDDGLSLAGIDGRQFSIVCRYLRERLVARGVEADIPTLPDLADLDEPDVVVEPSPDTLDECTCARYVGALCPVCHKGVGR